MKIFVGAAWVAALACGLACGGQVEPGGDGGPTGNTSSGGSASSGSGGSAGNSGGETLAPCPTDPPVPGSQCEGPGQQGCAYFAPEGTCEAFVCNSSSVWATSSEGC